MITWSNLFAGSNIFYDVFYIHGEMYSQAVEQGSVFYLYNQMMAALPGDISLLIAILFNSMFPIVLLAAVLFSFFMPFFKFPQKW